MKMTTNNLLSNFIFFNDKENNEILLDKLIEEAIKTNNYSFSNGLLGIGWLISYLTKNNMLEVDIDEILYEVDDHIYKMTINAVATDKPSLENLIQLISYCHQRLLNELKPNNFYRRFAQIESLKLLIDKSTIIIEKYYSTFSYERAKLILKLSYLIDTGFEGKNIEDFFYKTMETLVVHYKKIASSLVSLEDKYSLCYLMLASKQFANPYWEQYILKIINQIDFSEAGSNCLKKIAKSYNPLTKKSIKIDLPNSIERYELVFLLASNMKSIVFE